MIPTITAPSNTTAPSDLSRMVGHPVELGKSFVRVPVSWFHMRSKAAVLATMCRTVLPLRSRRFFGSRKWIGTHTGEAVSTTSRHLEALCNDGLIAKGKRERGRYSPTYSINKAALEEYATTKHYRHIPVMTGELPWLSQLVFSELVFRWLLPMNTGLFGGPENETTGWDSCDLEGSNLHGDVSQFSVRGLAVKLGTSPFAIRRVFTPILNAELMDLYSDHRYSLNVPLPAGVATMIDARIKAMDDLKAKLKTKKLKYQHRAHSDTQGGTF